jgi:hypothetical protein
MTKINLTIVFLMVCVPFTAQSQFPEDCVVAGRVVTDKDVPVQGAMVYLFPLDRPAPSRPETEAVRTDAFGRYELHTIPGKYAVHAFKTEAGYPDVIAAFHVLPDRELPSLTVAKGDHVTGLDVKLGPKLALISFRVTDAQTGNVLTSVSYELCQSGRPRPTYCFGRSASGETNIYVPPIAVELVISAKGYKEYVYGEGRQPYILIPPGETKSLEVTLFPSK